MKPPTAKRFAFLNPRRVIGYFAVCATVYAIQCTPAKRDAAAPPTPLMQQVLDGQNAPRPDIVVILVDDMGYSDLGAYGGEIQTPVLDSLASHGLRFTRFYNTGRCAPTRASLLTGLYSHQAGVGEMVRPENRPGYYGRITDRTVTVAEMLREAGYQTLMSGKWHVTHYDYTDNNPDEHRESWPLQRGFDRFFGTIAGAGSFYNPKSLLDGNTFIKPEPGFYYTDAINDRAIEMIDQADPGQPLFLYLAHVAPHWPLHAHEEDIARYDGVYDGGWDSLRDVRYARMLEMGLIDPEWGLSPRDPDVPAWDTVSNKRWETRRMQVYAAQLHALDRGLGRVAEAIRRRGRADNTLIVFMSDNGASHEVIGGVSTRHGYYARGGTRSDVDPGPPDTFASYGRSWANASNTPFRWFKTRSHEGGVATPLIVHWPAGLGEPGEFRHDPAHVIDLMPTFVQLAGGRYPEQVEGRPIPPHAGVSLVPALAGLGLQDRPLFWEHIGNRAVLSGDWKLVATADGPWELYNLDRDRSELNDLAGREPEIAARLEALWNDWADRSQVRRE